MIDSQGRGLVFIMSTPRSGSTLLCAMLGRHRQVFCPPETWLLLPLNAIRASSAKVVGLYDDEYARAAWRTLTDDQVFNQASAAFAVTVYNSLLAQHNKQILIDKTPRYYNILPWVDLLFPAAIKIWLRRNPLDVIASCRDTWGISIAELTGEIVSPHSFDVTIAFELLASHFESTAATKIQLSYEELVQAPQHHIEELCRAMNLNIEEDMTNYGANTKLLNMYADAVMGDKKVLEHRLPHAKSVGRWRELLTPDDIRRILTTLGQDIFQRLGYGSLFEEAAARAGLDPAEINSKGKLDLIHQAYAGYVQNSMLKQTSIQQANLADQLRIAHDLLRTIQSGRVYKVTRRLGGWKWVEQSIKAYGINQNDS